MKTTVITVGAVTYAIKARKLLSSNGIRSKLVKVNSEKTSRGCTYGIEFYEKNLLDVVSILKAADFSYQVYGSEVKK